jgi:hypothetical protein
MPSWLESGWFSYSVTRTITLRYFNAVFLVVGTLYVIFSTFVSVIGSGYETVSAPAVGSSFNLSNPLDLWYLHFLPNLPGIHQAQDCSPSIIPVNEGSTPLD